MTMTKEGKNDKLKAQKHDSASLECEMPEKSLVEQLLADAVEWAKGVGEIHLSGFRREDLKIDTKSCVYDVVTQIDKECENYLIDKITSHYPDHSILGEETGAHDKPGADFRWVIDPLDGTNNYSQGLPVFCVSIGIEYKGHAVVGVVFAPYLREMYSAVRGGGAFLNGRRLRVSEKRDLAHSVLATGFPYDKGTHPVNNIANAARIIPHLRGIRRMGSAAYDLCCVAAAWFDGYWEMTLNPWDASAGCLIVEEAGGIVRPFREDRGISIIAGNPTIVDLIDSYIE